MQHPPPPHFTSPHPMPDTEFTSLCDALIHSRQHVGPKHLAAPGPDAATLLELLGAAAAAPDHGRITPWRFVVLGPAARQRLAELFEAHLLARDALASPAQLAEAREKAFRGPVLLMAVVRLQGPGQRQRDEASEGPAKEIPPWERLVSLGAAVQNLLLAAAARGFGSGLTSGRALQDAALREAFGLGTHEQAVCFINLGTPLRSRGARPRPEVAQFTTWLD